MKKINIKENYSFLVPIAIISIVVLVIGAFIFYSLKERNKQAQTPAQILAQIQEYRQKLQAENDKLSDLERKFSYRNKLATILDGYTKATNIINETDIFFKNAGSDNQQLNFKTKNNKIGEEIMAKRLAISKILETWKQQLSDPSINFTQATIDQYKKDIASIEAYISQLKSTISGLTSSDSGLSESDLAAYKKLIEDKNSEIKEIVSSVPSLDLNLIVPTTPATTTPVVITPVTEQDIQEQKDIIANIEEEIVILEQDLADKQAELPTTTIIVPQNIDQGAPNLLQNWVPIQYQQRPLPYKDTGVDVIEDQNKPALLQGW